MFCFHFSKQNTVGGRYARSSFQKKKIFHEEKLKDCNSSTLNPKANLLHFYSKEQRHIFLKLSKL
jgi:hypothetical protein